MLTPEPDRLTAGLRDSGATITADQVALSAGVVLHQLLTDQPDLEDAFLQLASDGAAI